MAKCGEPIDLGPGNRWLVPLVGMILFMSLAQPALAQAPSCTAPHQSRDGFVAVVDLSDLCLHLEDGRSFPIAGPARSSLTPRGVAVVLGIIADPWWVPTAETRQAYKARFGFTLPERIPPYYRDRRNAMGRLKVLLHFQDLEGDQVFRIHGTNDEGSIGRRVSRGCIRLRNDDALRVGEALEKGNWILFQD